MIEQFFSNILKIGFSGIVLYAFVLLMIHQALALLLVKIEEYLGMPVQFYWYDIPIALFFIFIFILLFLLYIIIYAGRCGSAAV